MDFRFTRRPRVWLVLTNKGLSFVSPKAEIEERGLLMWLMWQDGRGCDGHVTSHLPTPPKGVNHARASGATVASSALCSPLSASRSVPASAQPSMSSLRRFAQTNAAVSASPRTGGSTSASTAASPTTPVRGNPTTPRARLIYPISPVTSPSLSASQPFDWEAARSRRPPPYPYSTPSGKRKSRSSDVGTGMGTPGKRVVRKKSLYDR